MTSCIYLISGIPASGKTWFGDWLRDNRGFVHLDIESEAFQDSQLGAYFRRLLLIKEACLFPCQLRRIHPRVVITWGFPFEAYISAVKSLESGSAQTWWFDADIGRASEEWVRAKRQPISHATAQFDDLQNRREQIISYYGSRILRTLESSGERKPPEEIARALRIPDYPSKQEGSSDLLQSC